jgi:hypothetical protein
MGSMSKSEPTLPLTPAVFHILLALFGKERHGYDIMQQVRADSGDAVKAPRDAGHVLRDTSPWDAAKQHFALFQVTV